MLPHIIEFIPYVKKNLQLDLLKPVDDTLEGKEHLEALENWFNLVYKRESF